MSPRSVQTGCQALTAARRAAGDSAVELLFPYYFELDTLPAPGGGQVIVLPRGDLNQMAGGWSWRLLGDSIHVDAVSEDGAWHLVVKQVGPDWAGTLVAWRGHPLARWEVAGRWVPCPAGWRRGRES